MKSGRENLNGKLEERNKATETKVRKVQSK